MKSKEPARVFLKIDWKEKGNRTTCVDRFWKLSGLKMIVNRQQITHWSQNLIIPNLVFLCSHLYRSIWNKSRVKMSTPDCFFAEVEHYDSEDLCHWQGELYLELHNGTYTSQAKVLCFEQVLNVWLRFHSIYQRQCIGF